MKKITRIAYIYALCAILGACSDSFLDEDAPYVSEDNFFETQKQADMALVGCYDVLGWDEYNFFFWLGDIFGHDAYKGGEGPGDNAWIEPLLSFHYDANNEGLLTPYKQYYIGINRCNRVIDKVALMKADAIEDDARAEIIAEARFLRSYYYFELVKIFGEVPLVDHVLEVGHYKVPRAELTELWKFIEDDFSAAADVLPLKSEQKLGRANKGAAQAYLCKAYVYQKKWPEALAIANEIIDSHEYDLEPDYEDNWKIEHENGMESIFEIQFESSGTGEWGDGNEGNMFVIFTRSRGNYDGWGFNCPTQSFSDRFEPGDPRRDATIIDDGEILWQGTDDETVADNSFPSNIDHMHVQKYQLPPSQYGDQSDDPNNWILLRYADVLLWAAEAAAHTGDDWESYLQLVRDRVSMGPTPYADPLQAVYHEREVELGMEGHRLWDVIRQGRGEEVFGQYGYVEGVNNHLPIPQSQLSFIEE